MADVSNILSNERILLRTRRSRSSLIRELAMGCGMGVLFGAVLGGGAWLIAIIAGGESTGMVVGLIIFSLIFPLILSRAYIAWRGTVLTITSKRILLIAHDALIGQGNAVKHYHSFWRTTTQTVRWDFYQESAYEGGVVNSLCNTGVLTVRYGTADAARSFSVKSLPYASDIKHYMDKIHSLLAAKVPESELPAFVRKRKGKRDVPVTTEWV